MIALVRIKGMVGVNEKIENAMYRLKLRRKYSCVLINKQTKENEGMIIHVQNMVAYGNIDDKTLQELISKRGQLIDKTKKLGKVEEIIQGIKQGKELKEFNLKPFFRLHPPRKGINSKSHFPKGILGDNKEKINELIARML